MYLAAVKGALLGADDRLVGDPALIAGAANLLLIGPNIRVALTMSGGLRKRRMAQMES